MAREVVEVVRDWGSTAQEIHLQFRGESAASPLVDHFREEPLLPLVESPAGTLAYSRQQASPEK